jgi:hypothetical protein
LSKCGPGLTASSTVLLKLAEGRAAADFLYKKYRRAAATMGAGTLLALLVVVAALWGAGSFACAPPRRYLGYWARDDGGLFELRLAPAGGLSAVTACGAHGAAPGRPYPCKRLGCRRFEVAFPGATLRGTLSLDRRLLDFGGAGGVWRRQGLVRE